jgi:hypothetical protein
LNPMNGGREVVPIFTSAGDKNRGNSSVNLFTIVGARPQFIKAAAVSRAIEFHNSRLGGSLNRNPREWPGPQTIMRGLCRLQDIKIGYRLGKGVSVDAIAIGRF